MTIRKVVLAVVLLAVIACCVSCATYTFKCTKSISWALTTDTNPASCTGMCDGQKTVVMQGPGPAAVEHVCDTGKMHWFAGNKLTCIPDPCAPGVTIFGVDGGLACGNQ